VFRDISKSCTWIVESVIKEEKVCLGMQSKKKSWNDSIKSPVIIQLNKREKNIVPAVGSYLKRVIVQLHNNGLGRAHPALHVNERRRAPRRGCRLLLLVVIGLTTVSTFRQIFVHVLGKVA